jgi:hypothetical protein
VYFADLCELCVWENHGLLYEREAAPFAGVGVEHHDLVERRLWSLAAELARHRLGYQAEVAMGLVAYLQAATPRLDRLVATAERLGSDQWMPIVALAEAALAAGRRDLARRVFAAANRPGHHQDYLAARCLELTGEPPPRSGVNHAARCPASSQSSSGSSTSRSRTTCSPVVVSVAGPPGA